MSFLANPPLATSLVVTEEEDNSNNEGEKATTKRGWRVSWPRKHHALNPVNKKCGEEQLDQAEALVCNTQELLVQQVRLGAKLFRNPFIG